MAAATVSAAAPSHAATLARSSVRGRFEDDSALLRDCFFDAAHDGLAVRIQRLCGPAGGPPLASPCLLRAIAGFYA